VLPDPGKYASGMFFVDKATAALAEETFAKFAKKYGLEVIQYMEKYSKTCKLHL
jgi:hypothetical protein